MLNYLWSGMIILAFITAIFTNNLEVTVKALAENAKNSVDLSLSLMGMMCFWCGIMEIAKETGAVSKLTKILKPLFKKIFKDIPDGHPAEDAIFMNISANILGIGNASTPLGLKAMNEMQKLNSNKQIATHDMCMFVVLNTASLQLIPASIIALRSANNAQNPTDVIPYILIASFVSCIFVIIMCKMLQKHYWR